MERLLDFCSDDPAGQEKKKKEADISCCFPLFPGNGAPIYVIKLSNAAHTLRSGQWFLYLKGERGEKSSLHFWSE